MLFLKLCTDHVVFHSESWGCLFSSGRRSCDRSLTNQWRLRVTIRSNLQGVMCFQTKTCTCSDCVKPLKQNRTHLSINMNRFYIFRAINISTFSISLQFQKQSTSNIYLYTQLKFPYIVFKIMWSLLTHIWHCTRTILQGLFQSLFALHYKQEMFFTP